MWDKVIWRVVQGCMITVLVGATSLFGVRTIKEIKDEVKRNGGNSK